VTTDHDDQERDLALVTGASSGIGLALAREFVAHGHDVIVAAEDDDIRHVPDTLRADGPGTVTPVQVDLATRLGVDELLQAVWAMPKPLQAVAINAGIGVAGPFVDRDVDDQLQLVELNVAGAVQLAHAVLKGMVGRGEGGVLFTSSIAATMPGPYMATYNASKAFLLAFAEALHVEVEEHGVRVTALMPGPTDTDFFARAGMEDTKLSQAKKDDPRDVARDGYDALMRGADHVVAGSLKNKAQAVAGKFMPYERTARVHATMSEPGSGDDDS
jgi:short-subunit dehydrogenase